MHAWNVTSLLYEDLTPLYDSAFGASQFNLIPAVVPEGGDESGKVVGFEWKRTLAPGEKITIGAF